MRRARDERNLCNVWIFLRQVAETEINKDSRTRQLLNKRH